MDWVSWMLIAVALVLCGLLALLRAKGLISNDTAAAAFGALFKLVHRAEDLWSGYRGAGAQKKEWVLSQLQDLGLPLSPAVAGELIDAVVAWLNETGWKK